MATTYVDTTASGGQTDFEFTFPYLEDEHVKVEINGVATTAFTITTTPTQKVVLDSGATAGDQVRVRRRSAPNENLVDFVNGSVLTESELDLAYRHNRYLAEEIAELNDASLQIEVGGTQWDAKNLRIQNVATPTDTTDAVTKIYLDNKVAQVSSGSTQPPLKWQFTGVSGANGTYTVTGAEVQGDTAYDVSIDGLVKEPGVDFTVDPSTDTLTIVPTLSGGEDIVVIQRGFGVAVTGTVGTNSLVDGSVTNAKLATGAVTSDKTSLTDLVLNESLTVEGSSYGRVEIGGPSGAFIDLKSPSTDDHDARLFTYGTTLYIHGKYGIGINTGDPAPVRAITMAADGKVYIGSASTPTHALDVAGDVNITGDYKVNGTNLQTVPTGTVSAFAGSAAPTGYLLCDGTAVNRTTYATLFGVISDTYGVGDGSTTFNLPDLRGRVVAGLGESLLGATADTLGEDNGLIADTKTHLLTAAESGLPAHSHSQGATASTGGVIESLSGGASGGSYTSTGTVSAQNASSAHNNVQPTIILNYIIKI